MSILKMQQNFEKMIIVLKIIAFEVKPLISVNYDKNTCGRPATS